MSGVDDALDVVLRADRQLRVTQARLVDEHPSGAIATAITKARKRLATIASSEDFVSAQIRMCEVLAEVGDAVAVRALVELLNSEDPEVRFAAGDALLDLGYERYADVARAFETAIGVGRAVEALREVPYILAELGEPGGVSLCLRLLAHDDADVAGAAIEGLARLGDASAIGAIQKLVGDERALAAVDEDEPGPLTVGELARAALEWLANARSDEDDA